jgi:hypothetical protein
MVGTQRKCWQEDFRLEWGQPQELLSLEPEQQQQLGQQLELERQQERERELVTVWEPQEPERCWGY